MLPIAALLLLCIGGLLEVAGVAFWGLDLVVALCFVGSMLLGAGGVIRGQYVLWALIAFSLAALALGLHLCLNLGIFG
jgi:hypothetical protein